MRVTLHELSSDPDLLKWRTPNAPSELAALTDQELIVLWRKVAFGNGYPFEQKVEKELQARLIVALTSFHESSERSATTIARLTWALVALTIVLVALTAFLIVDA